MQMLRVYNRVSVGHLASSVVSKVGKHDYCGFSPQGQFHKHDVGHTEGIMSVYTSTEMSVQFDKA